jgi:putative oxidoreductase
MAIGAHTQSSLGLLWLRIMMGLGMAYHGYGKVFGGHMEGFAEGVANMGFPAPMLFAWLAALSEFAGGLLVAVGLGTRYAACMIFGTMFVAAFVRHAADPLQVKELALAYWAMAGALICTGGGKFALERKLWGTTQCTAAGHGGTASTQEASHA